MTDPQHEETFADTERKLREIITTLRAQLAEAHKDGFQLAAWQCLFEDGKTGIVCDDWGNQYCAMQRRADRAEAALAAQIEADAGETIAWAYSHAAGGYTVCDDEHEARRGAEDIGREMTVRPLYFIRNQPHDRTALDRMLTKARENALRDAAGKFMDGSAPQMAILALIEGKIA